MPLPLKLLRQKTRVMEPRRSGGALQVCRRGGEKVWRYGGLEVCCGPGDVEVWRSGGAL